MDNVQTVYKVDEYDLNEIILWLNFQMVANKISVDDAEDFPPHMKEDLFSNAVILYDMLGDFDTIPYNAHMSPPEWDRNSLLVINSRDATDLMRIFSECYFDAYF